MSTVETKATLHDAALGVGRNAAILGGVTLLCKAGSFVVVPFILRAFPREAYGAYSAAFAYAGLLGMVAYFGMNPIVIRDIARGDRPKGTVLFHCTALRLGLLGISALVLFGVGLYSHFSRQMWALGWLAFAVMGFDALTGALKASMQAQGRFGLMAAVETVRKSGQWGLAFLVIFTGAGITMLAAATAAAAAAATAAAVLLGTSKDDFSDVRFAPGYAMRMLKLSAPMGLSAALVLALDRVDILVLERLKGPAEVGIYAAATAFKPDFVAQCVVWAMLPLAFKLAKDDREGLAQALRTAGRYLLICGAAIAIVCVCGGGILVEILAGAKYAASVPVFRIMGLSLPFIFVSFLYLHALTAVDKQAYAAAIFAAGLAVNVAVDLALVPSMGAPGAILGTLVTEVLIAGAALLLVWRFVGCPFTSSETKTGLAIAAAAATAGAMQALGINDLGAAALAVLGAVLFLSKALKRSDLEVIRLAFSK